MGYSLRVPELHRVVIDYQKLTWLAISRALEAGGERIGLFVPSHLDENTFFHYRSAWAGYRDIAGGKHLLPLYSGALEDGAPFVAWLERWRPGILLVPGGRTELAVRSHLEGHTRSKLWPIRLLNLSLNSPQSGNGGIYQDAMEVGVEAINYLVQLIHSNEKGIPHSPRTIMLSGTWIEGTPSVAL